MGRGTINGRIVAVFATLFTAVTLSGCSTPGSRLDAQAAAPYFKAPADNGSIRDYRVGPLDKINITVFQVPDLTLQGVQVDASGRLLLPLIGSVQAAGKTTEQLSSDIAARLGSKYLESPQVSVIVAESVSQRVTVEGSVLEAGVYQLTGPTSLEMAIAMARGPSRVAALSQGVVFRRIEGKRMGAVFDLSKIRSGEAEDPEILGNDVVIVGFSNIKGAWRDFLTAAPLVAAFRPFD